ncbi:UDP-N-acetylmuramoyl-L-alanine--D-glutamate ligase [Halopseudomonas salegens]|uniref:UDP-N-acetylmuramoylalanine--D-glutamate ligase n=1 Tax=Halopseudomonas salegens TaxID=1434072 RepID=A0A1H2GRI9_9GAMM|nr:UDP-N-acetylmuramoyl-L-alanine--D-glutamate ligase [Halopseudomonas salegens]SDU22247.1 UDP-N-acetylmuramoylalanine--D-glutamate ligase [Halopseudomonas salegens]
MALISTDKQRIIVGLGSSGLAVARYLAGRGVPFAVCDTRSQPPGLEQLKRFAPMADLHLGELNAALLSTADELIVSPGIALSIPALQAAKAAGVSLVGDIELFAREAKAPIVAITGSNAKSTVTTLVGEMAKAAGIRVAVGGNLGTPALDLLDQKAELYVLEVSSFQLETTERLNAEVATVLNISEDHMDRYVDLVSYHQAKHRIFRGARQIVINRDDALSQPLVADQLPRWSFGLSRPDLRGFGLLSHNEETWLAFEFKPLLPVSALKVRGAHNQANALAALALGHAAGLPMSAMLAALQSFTGLPHRCQWVAERGQVQWYNDSKATNVGAALAAIQGLAAGFSGKQVLIAGGDAKGADLVPLVEPISQHCRAVILLGKDAPSLARILNGRVPLIEVAGIEQAVAAAVDLAQIGDLVLLSPACASLDMFSSFEERGQRFADAVEALPC